MMRELASITDKYDAAYLAKWLASLDSINAFALGFYKDAAEIFDILSRLKNVERNPTGFDLNDAPILGPNRERGSALPVWTF